MARENSHNKNDSPFRVRSRFYSPPEEFQGCFTTFYQLKLDVEHGKQVTDYLQPEWGNIRFFAGAHPSGSIHTHTLADARCVATGPSSLPLKFSLGTSRMWGIGFLPIGWARFIDADAAALANVVTDGEAHPAFAKFGGMCEVLCDPEASDEEQLAALTEGMGALMRPNRDETRIHKVHKVLMDDELASVADFARRADMSVRTLERISRRYFGFSPKLLMRRQRFMRSLTHFMLHANAKWTEAMDGLYHDQAQFSREFRQFMTMTPSEYARLDHPVLDSFVEARARIWGSPAQTLDKPG